MRNWSRRECAALGFAAAASACTTASSAQAAAPSPSLDALAKAKGLRFGAAIATRDVNDPRYCDIVRAECGVLVAENEHKWPYVHPASEQFTFERGDQLTAFGEANGILVRGHNLIWHHPRWLANWVTNYDFGADPRAGAERLLVEHIRAVCTHYGTRIRSWDVVNETIDADTGEMRETVFTRHLGPQVIDVAFRAAREAAPHAQLVYNDYMTWEDRSAAHRSGVLRLLERLRANGTPIDALGVQGHIDTRDSTGIGAAQEAAWRRFMDEATGMGLKILITELDVNDRGLPADVAVRNRAVADYARAFLDLTLSYPQVEQVLTWGVVDHRSWLQNLTPRADGLAKRPLFYDENYQPKPMREAIAASFRAAPARSQGRP